MGGWGRGSEERAVEPPVFHDWGLVARSSLRRPQPPDAQPPDAQLAHCEKLKGPARLVKIPVARVRHDITRPHAVASQFFFKILLAASGIGRTVPHFIKSKRTAPEDSVVTTAGVLNHGHQLASPHGP